MEIHEQRDGALVRQRLMEAGIDVREVRSLSSQDRQELVIALVRMFGSLRLQDLCELTSSSYSTISRVIKILRNDGQLHEYRCPDRVHGRPAVWFCCTDWPLPDVERRNHILSLVEDLKLVLHREDPVQPTDAQDSTDGPPWDASPDPTVRPAPPATVQAEQPRPDARDARPHGAHLWSAPWQNVPASGEVLPLRPLTGTPRPVVPSHVVDRQPDVTASPSAAPTTPGTYGDAPAVAPSPVASIAPTGSPLRMFWEHERMRQQFRRVGIIPLSRRPWYQTFLMVLVGGGIALMLLALGFLVFHHDFFSFFSPIHPVRSMT